MKTLVKEGVSVFLFEDTVMPQITSDLTILSYEPYEAIADCSSNNTVLHEGVTPPDDWIGNKYLFDGTTWEANPDWADPEVEPEDQP